jgi:hypothetical protein
MQLVALQSFIDAKVADLLVYSAPTMASLFPADLRGIPFGTGPRLDKKSGSSSHELFLYFRVCDR